MLFNLFIDASPGARTARADRLYRTIWRWHFYAGLFCVPFVLCLATTGSIYLFRPQIESWLDRPYRDLAASATAAPSMQVNAALSAVPGAPLRAYQLPLALGDAAQILVERGGRVSRVYVHPTTARVLRVVDEESRPMRILARLHGELLLGDKGSMVVELAASWAIVMLLTGLYLWWPRGARGLGGVAYPRLRRGDRVFWRDLHGVTAFWVSSLALFLLVSGLPWAKSWGSLLRGVRQWNSAAVVQQDWPTGSADTQVANALDIDPHAAHHEHHAQREVPGATPIDVAALDRIVATARGLALEPPVLIAPPSPSSPAWSAKSDAANRPLRGEATFDANGTVLGRTTFVQRPLVDRVIGYGVAAHEGQLFGPFNQALGVVTALGLIIVCVSAVKLWWSRRPAETLGARPSIAGARVPVLLVALIVALAIVLPLLGISLVLVTAFERLVLRRIPTASHFLGLAGTPELQTASR